MQEEYEYNNILYRTSISDTAMQKDYKLQRP